VIILVLKPSKIPSNLMNVDCAFAPHPELIGSKPVYQAEKIAITRLKLHTIVGSHAIILTNERDYRLTLLVTKRAETSLLIGGV